MIVAGVDEVGRGPLAGPVVSAAVILDSNQPIEGLADSKVLTAKRRAELFIEITEKAIAWGIGRSEPREIDKHNILNATMISMRRAIFDVGVPLDKVLIDGNRCPDVPMEAEAIIKGDQKVAAISAASIVAKHLRDIEMIKLHKRYPNYGFDCHKGYPTQLHRDMLILHGPCCHHRRSFRPVRECLCKT